MPNSEMTLWLETKVDRIDIMQVNYILITTWTTQKVRTVTNPVDIRRPHRSVPSTTQVPLWSLWPTHQHPSSRPDIQQPHFQTPNQIPKYGHGCCTHLSRICKSVLLGNGKSSCSVLNFHSNLVLPPSVNRQSSTSLSATSARYVPKSNLILYSHQINKTLEYASQMSTTRHNTPQNLIATKPP